MDLTFYLTLISSLILIIVTVKYLLFPRIEIKVKRTVVAPPPSPPPPTPNVLANLLAQVGITPEIQQALIDASKSTNAELLEMTEKAKTVYIEPKNLIALQHFIYLAENSQEIRFSYFAPLFFALMINFAKTDYKLWHNLAEKRLILEPWSDKSSVYIFESGVACTLEDLLNCGVRSHPFTIRILKSLLLVAELAEDKSTPTSGIDDIPIVASGTPNVIDGTPNVASGTHKIPQSMELLIPLVVKDLNYLCYYQAWNLLDGQYPILKLSRKNDISSLSGEKKSAAKTASETIDDDDGNEDTFVLPPDQIKEGVSVINKKLTVLAQMPGMSFLEHLKVPEDN